VPCPAIEVRIVVELPEHVERAETIRWPTVGVAVECDDSRSARRSGSITRLPHDQPPDLLRTELIELRNLRIRRQDSGDFSGALR
jgi:hypothetical protein